VAPDFDVGDPLDQVLPIRQGNHSARLLNSGRAGRMVSSSSTCTANSGISPINARSLSVCGLSVQQQLGL